jgi:hypothetical protein
VPTECIGDQVTEAPYSPTHLTIPRFAIGISPYRPRGLPSRFEDFIFPQAIAFQQRNRLHGRLESIVELVEPRQIFSQSTPPGTTSRREIT